MAVGSWAKMPLFPGLSNVSYVTKIVKKCMTKGDQCDEVKRDSDTDAEDKLDVEMIVSKP